jgi:hypothetical protein
MTTIQSAVTGQARRTRRNRGKSGASLIFVLGIMMMLMAIGFSVFAAASANRGAALRQTEHNAVLLLENSIHNNIRHSLQYGDGYKEDRLWNQLLQVLYEARHANPESLHINNFNILPIGGIDLGSGGISIAGIELLLELIEIDTDTRTIVTDPGDPDADPPVPATTVTTETVQIGVGKMFVDVTLNVNGNFIKSTTEYSFNGGRFVNGVLIDDGKWELEWYEKSEA